MNDRLTSFSSKNNLINKEQIGFQKNARTSDHFLTLKTVANKYVSDKKGKKLYICFIDFKKAFDSVWHKGLFYKLESKGINGNFLRLLQNIYSKTKCSLKIIGIEIEIELKFELNLSFSNQHTIAYLTVYNTYIFKTLLFPKKNIRRHLEIFRGL